jgi:hypothetical protein
MGNPRETIASKGTFNHNRIFTADRIEKRFSSKPDAISAPPPFESCLRYFPLATI